MFQVDEFFQRFVIWVLYKYWNIFLQNEDRFFQFIKENFSGDDKKTDREFLEETFRRFKYWNVLLLNETIFSKYIKENFSGDDKKSDRKFLEKTFRRLNAPGLEPAKKDLRKILIDELKLKELKRDLPQQVNYEYQSLEKILLSIFIDKHSTEKHNLGVDFLFNAAITDFPGFDQCWEDENLKEKLFTQDPKEEGGFTPLHWAVFCGSSDFIKSCMKITDNEFLSDLLKVEDEDGKTSFQLAIYGDNVDVILAFKKDEVSLQQFAEWNTYGKPLLYYALENNAYEFAKFILPRINLDAFPNGIEALCAAARSGNIELIEVVLPYCPNFGDLNSQFRTVIGEAIRKIKQLRRQKKLVPAEMKRELNADIKNLVSIVQYFLEKGITPTYSEQHYITRYVDKGVIPLNDNNIKEIVDNYKKEVRLKTFLSISILIYFLLAGKGAQFMGAAADAGQISGAGLSLVGISIILAMTTFGLIVTPREKILIGLAALKALPRRVRNTMYRLWFGPNYSSESYELNERDQMELFYSQENDSTLIIRRALRTNSVTLDLEEEAQKSPEELTERSPLISQPKFLESDSDSDTDLFFNSLKEEENSSETKLDIEETKPDTSPEYGFP